MEIKGKSEHGDVKRHSCKNKTVKLRNTTFSPQHAPRDSTEEKYILERFSFDYRDILVREASVDQIRLFVIAKSKYVCVRALVCMALRNLFYPRYIRRKTVFASNLEVQRK